MCVCFRLTLSIITRHPANFPPSNPTLHFTHSLKLLNETSSACITCLERTAVRFIDTVLFGKMPRVHFTIISLNTVKSLVTVMQKFMVNPLNPKLNPICYLLALLADHFLHISRIRVKSLYFRLLMAYIYIYIYTHTHIYIYIYTHTHIYIYTHTHIYIYIWSAYS